MRKGKVAKLVRLNDDKAIKNYFNSEIDWTKPISIYIMGKWLTIVPPKKPKHPPRGA